jgi:hypothetical protein
MMGKDKCVVRSQQSQDNVRHRKTSTNISSQSRRSNLRPLHAYLKTKIFSAKIYITHKDKYLSLYIFMFHLTTLTLAENMLCRIVKIVKSELERICVGLI